MTDLEATDRRVEQWIEESAQEDRERAMKARERIIAARRGGEEKTE